MDRPLDEVELCKANDYAACGALGCAGDQHAAELAAKYDAPTSCVVRSARRLVHTGVTPAARPPFDSIEAHRLETPRHADFRYQLYNRGLKRVERFAGAIYDYDAAGEQLERIPFSIERVLAAGAGTTFVVPGNVTEAPLWDKAAIAAMDLSGEFRKIKKGEHSRGVHQLDRLPGRVHRSHLDVIDYLKEENRVLMEQLGDRQV